VVVLLIIRAIEALENLKRLNEDETTGIAIVKRAIEEPLRQICQTLVVKVRYRCSESKRRKS
jgi:chaperonin GroEL (HSP60 family)